MTLPMIHFLRTAPMEHRALLRSLPFQPGCRQDRADSQSHPAEQIDSVRARPRARTRRYRARGAVAALPESESKRVPRHDAEFVVSRPM